MIVDKADYLDKMENLLNNTRKYEKFNRILNFAANQEKRVNNVYKNLLRLIVYLRKQGDLLNQLGLGQA